MTGRERVSAALNFQEPDRIAIQDSPWWTTIARWHKEGLPEGVAQQPRPQQPAGMVQGNNSWPAMGYRGPAPPTGKHRYYFKLYALDVELDLEPGLDKEALLAAIDGHVLAEGQLMGTYER